MRPDDDVLLRDMLDHARLALDASRQCTFEDLLDDPVLAAALERFVEVIGEAASKVSPELKSETPQIPWREIVGMRNRLVHGYASVDRRIIWDVVSGDLPELAAEIQKILSQTDL